MSGSATATRKKRVVIVGGGFAGAYAARALERRLRGRDDVEILLYCRENYTVFQPMLPEVISGTIGLTDVVTPLRRMLKRTHVHVREIESIDARGECRQLAPGVREARIVAHDLLQQADRRQPLALARQRDGGAVCFQNRVCVLRILQRLAVCGGGARPAIGGRCSCPPGHRSVRSRLARSPRPCVGRAGEQG